MSRSRGRQHRSDRGTFSDAQSAFIVFLVALMFDWRGVFSLYPLGVIGAALVGVVAVAVALCGPS